MSHTQAFWLRTLRLPPLKPFALPPGCPGERVGLRGQGERPRSWSHSGGPGERVGVMQESRDPGADILGQQLYRFTLKPFGFAHCGSIHSSLLAPVAAWFKSHYHHYRWEDAG